MRLVYVYKCMPLLPKLKNLYPSEMVNHVQTMGIAPLVEHHAKHGIPSEGLNQYVQTEHFKMEGIHVLKYLLSPGDWMVKVDQKDAYFYGSDQGRGQRLPQIPVQRQAL